MARKNLKLRRNSKEYVNLCLQMTGVAEDIEKSYELMAYAMETKKGLVNNKFAEEICRIVEGET